MPVTEKKWMDKIILLPHSQNVLKIAKAAARSPVTSSNSQKHVGEFSKSKIIGFEITH